MSAAIKPGDLVMVVRATPCCGSAASIGGIGIVEPNPDWAISATCDQCGHVNYDVDSFRTIQGGGYHVATLKKLDPPTVEDEIERVRELETT